MRHNVATQVRMDLVRLGKRRLDGLRARAIRRLGAKLEQLAVVTAYNVDHALCLGGSPARVAHSIASQDRPGSAEMVLCSDHINTIVDR